MSFFDTYKNAKVKGISLHRLGEVPDSPHLVYKTHYKAKL